MQKPTTPPGVRRRQWGSLVIAAGGAVWLAALTLAVAVKLVRLAPGSGSLVVMVVFLALMAAAFGAIAYAEFRDLRRQR